MLCMRSTLDSMTEEPTPANLHIRAALEGLTDKCEPLAGMRLKHWYVIVTHIDEAGNEVLSRFSGPNQMRWTDAGLLTFALRSEERESAEEEGSDPDPTYT